MAAYRIGEKCIKCHACVWNRICPVEAIIEENGILKIDPARCTGCGRCFENEEYFCPVRAIVRE
ncbi:MAG: 4Fe-4S binding protein [Dehalococcoidales bacterium]|jgi:ferredoxin|nr:4Fe-4S binding protein [Dehalococcoidales bacterium]